MIGGKVDDDDEAIADGVSWQLFSLRSLILVFLKELIK